MKLAVCAHCDAVHRRVPLPANAHAHCVRCGSELYAARRTRLDAWLALTLACAVVFVIANVNPIMDVQLRGEHTQASLLDALLATWGSGAAPVAAFAALSAFVFPLLRISLELYVLSFLHLNRRPPGMPGAMQALRAMRPWSMIEVLMLGMLVSVVKLGGQATVIPGAGLAAFAVLTALLTVLSTYDPEALWERADRIPA